MTKAQREKMIEQFLANEVRIPAGGASSPLLNRILRAEIVRLRAKEQKGKELLDMCRLHCSCGISGIIACQACNEADGIQSILAAGEGR